MTLLSLNSWILRHFVQEEAVSAAEEAASLLSIVEETFLEEAEEILATTDGLLKQWTATT